METGAWKPESEKAADRAVTAAQDLTSRGAKEVGEVAQHGQRLIRDADRQVEEYTGKPSKAWLNEA
jgi:hypothetical protein